MAIKEIFVKKFEVFGSQISDRTIQTEIFADGVKIKTTKWSSYSYTVERAKQKDIENTESTYGIFVENPPRYYKQAPSEPPFEPISKEEEVTEEEKVEQNLGEIPPEATINPNINQSVAPVSKKFTVAGRVYDIETGEFLTKTKISVGLGDAALGLRSTRTDNQGKFKFKIQLQIDKETGQSYFTNYNLRYQKKGYSLERQPIIAADGTVLTTLNNVGLEIKTSRLEQEKSQLQANIEEATQQVKNLVPKDPGQALKNIIIAQYKRIKDSLIPIILALLATYGISRLRDFLNGDRSEVDCPPQNKINESISKKNRIVRQLNNIYKTIDSATKAVNATVRLISIFRVLARVLINIPIPTTFGIPPGPAGGVIFSIPASTINKIQEAIKKFDRLLAKFAGFSLPVLVALAMLQSILALCIQLLGGLDSVIAQCAGRGDTGDGIGGTGDGIGGTGDGIGDGTGGVQLSADLLAATQEAESDGEPAITEVNGFILDVVTVPNASVGSLQRRQAIAKNRDGVTLLKGDLSFSSSDQILLNELSFYIQVNNLKAD